MKKIVLLGPQQAGKSTLVNLLNQNKLPASKTVVPEYVGEFLDTPGEYIEHRLYYGRFQVLTSEYQIIGVVIPIKLDNIYIPPNFISMFPNKKHIGIITKSDLGTAEDIQKCKMFFSEIGIDDTYVISIFDEKSILELKTVINNYTK